MKITISQEGYNPISISIESKLSTKQRDKLPDSAYGLPEDRKYPLTDANHVRSAIRFFSSCPNEKKHQLAVRICRAAKKFGVEIDKESEVYKWAHK